MVLPEEFYIVVIEPGYMDYGGVYKYTKRKDVAQSYEGTYHTKISGNCIVPEYYLQSYTAREHLIIKRLKEKQLILIEDIKELDTIKLLYFKDNAEG